jgi:hypothetical protein
MRLSVHEHRRESGGILSPCGVWTAFPSPRSRMHDVNKTHEKSPGSSREEPGLVSEWTTQTEAEGLEPPKACARRISSAVPYQLDYASNDLSDTQVGTAGFEPATPRSRSECSTGLSHVPKYYPRSGPGGIRTHEGF